MMVNSPILTKIRNYTSGVWQSLSVIIRPSVLLAVLGLYILIIPVFILETASKKEATRLKTRLNEIRLLDSEYKVLKRRIDTLEERKSLTRVSGIAQALDDILASLGLKGKMKSMKVLGSREIKGATEESAEAQLEKVTMNELVNILYKIEDAPMILSIKKTIIKKSFEKPELLDVTLTLTLFIER